MKYTLKVIDAEGNINYPVNLSILGLGGSATYDIIDIRNPRVVSFEKSQFSIVEGEIERLAGFGAKAEIVKSHVSSGIVYYIDSTENIYEIPEEEGFQIVKNEFDFDSHTYDFTPTGDIKNNAKDLEKECQRLNDSI